MRFATLFQLPNTTLFMMRPGARVNNPVTTRARVGKDDHRKAVGEDIVLACAQNGQRHDGQREQRQKMDGAPGSPCLVSYG